jgi:uncharacterized membrane protein YbhN (UPF0104 family)
LIEELAWTAWSTAEAVGAHLAGVSPILLFAGLALHTLKLAARARAWQNVLRASMRQTSLRFRDAAVPYFAGIGAGAVVPFGGGQLLRVALARTRLRSCHGREGGASTATIVGSLAVERALDAAVSVVVIALALTASLLPSGALHARLAGLAGLTTHPAAAAVVGGGVALAAAVGWWGFRHRLAAACAGGLQGLVVLKQPKCYLASVASWQLLGWFLRFAALVLLLEAFHVPEALAVAPAVMSLQLLASAIPVTPGGAGTQQALIAAALGSGAILGFSAGAQAATILVDLLLGVTAIAICGIRPRLDAFRPAPVPA